MEGAMLKRGVTIGALFLKLGIPTSLLILLITPFVALIFVLADSEDGAAGISGGAPSEFAKNQIPSKYMPIYKAAEKKYGVPWNLLAAHHRVETNFSAGHIESYVGAMGAMQFMPCTWIGWGFPACDGLGDLDITAAALSDPAKIEEYGGYGVDGDGDGKADPNNPIDSIFSAAAYLAANGADEGMIEQAVFAYNHSHEYVSKVLDFAKRYASMEKITGAGGWPVPFTTNITSPFGYRTNPVTGSKELHNGLDIAAAGIAGKPAVAIMAGEIVHAGRVGGYGNTVIVKHSNGLETLYGHLKALRVTAGQKVKPGDVVGLVGSTGRSTGPHLHFTVSKNGTDINPMKILK